MIENKRFEIICENSSLVDVPLYVISGGDKLKFDIYGSKKDAERLCALLNENGLLKQENEKLEVIIKTGNCSLLQKENEQLKKRTEINNEIVKIIKKHLPIGFVAGLEDKQIENTVKSILKELKEEELLK